MRGLPGSAARLLLAAGAIVASACHPAAPTPAPSAGRPDIYLIVVDSLRYDHLGATGYHRRTSPTIDALAAGGVLFEQHTSSTSWTLPAHAALFTGLSDSVHGCVDVDRRLAPAHETLAERLRASGYRTAGFFSGPFLHPGFGLDQGFERYEDCTSYGSRYRDEPFDAWATGTEIMIGSHRDVTGPTVAAAFERWVATAGDGPVFAFVHLWDVHFDFIPPPPYDTMFDPGYEGWVTGENLMFDPRYNAGMDRRDLEHLVALYDGEIAWTDHIVARILAAAKGARRLDDAVVIVTSDHGTELFDHGGKGHRTTLYDELIRIPLVVHAPGRCEPGTRVVSATGIIDLAPTVLELAGATAPPAMMGVSLVPHLHGRAVEDADTEVAELFSIGRRLRTLRSPRYKLTHDMVRDESFWTDLGNDPGERLRRTSRADAVGGRLWSAYQRTVADLEAWRARVGAAGGAADVPGDVRRQLESLGYLEADR